MKRASSLCLCAWLATVGLAHGQSALLDAIRADDLAEVRAQLAGGADPNTPEQTGATPLMLAAAYASSGEMLTLLLDEGADIEATDAVGATALLWAWGNTSHVETLLDRGAAPTAATRDGTTAVFTTARGGNLDASRLLLERGADPYAVEDNGFDLLQLAYALRDPALRGVLVEHGRRLDSGDQLSAFSPLLANLTDPVTVQGLLDIGIDPEESTPFVTTEFRTVSLAAFHDLRDTVSTLLGHGAAVDLRDRGGRTPLMFAAAGTSRDAGLVRSLVSSGADVDARDARGRTALDWALTQGETEVSRLLRQAGATSREARGRPVRRSPPWSPRVSVQRALEQLQPIGPAFHEQTGCISCHNQSLPAIAVARARKHGLPVNEGLAVHPTAATLESWEGFRDDLRLARCFIPGFVANVTYGLLALLEEGVSPNRTTDAVARCLPAFQAPDGSWPMEGDPRPPLLDPGPIVSTVLALRTLSRYTPPGQRAALRPRLDRARRFLRSATPEQTQEQTFLLLWAAWSGASSEAVGRQRERLTALQQNDGGWAQQPGMTSDAYATGQALYALQEAGMSAEHARYQRGRQYLLSTQLEDGTWYVRSRAFGFQPYLDAGFPHGPDQFISAAATAWAVIGLTHGL